MHAFRKAGLDAWGIEPSRTFRERAVHQHDIDPARLLHASIETADLPTASFDLINMGAVVEHLQEPAAAVERATRWLAPGGLLWIAVPSADWLIGRLLNLVYRAQGIPFVTNLSPMHPPYHLYEFTRRSFEAHGQRAGYEVVHAHVAVCDTFAPKHLRRLAYVVMDRTDTGMALELWLRRNAEASRSG